MKLVSFDIETCDVFDLGPGEDLEKYAPFHVAVAAVVPDGEDGAVWLTNGADGRPSNNMTAVTARELLGHLRALQTSGHALCAWNGASFDLKWIGFAAEDMKTAATIALDLYDPMLQFFNRKGFPVGLDAVAKGMGLGVTKILKSADAPKLWCKGEHDRVMEYVRSDATITNAAVAAIHRSKAISWITQKGERRQEHIGALKTVREVLAEPEPDQSWMKTPIRRDKFVGWIKKTT